MKCAACGHDDEGKSKEGKFQKLTMLADDTGSLFGLKHNVVVSYDCYNGDDHSHIAYASLHRCPKCGTVRIG